MYSSFSFVGLITRLLAFASILHLQCALAQKITDYSFAGVRRYRDSGGGIYNYYPITNVPGQEDEKFFFGTYTWLYPKGKGISSTNSKDVGYLINCRTTQITQIFAADHVNTEMLNELPKDIASNLRRINATRIVQVKGLESKNYRKHNVLHQVVTYMDTGAFWLTCNYEPTFE